MGEHVLEMRAPRRARAILNNLLVSRTVTPSGVKWLEVATDPFHDTEIRPDGYPDMVSTRSITQTVTQTITVNAPSGVTTNWDLHVFFAPLAPTFTQSDVIPSSTLEEEIHFTTDTVYVGKPGQPIKLGKTDHDAPVKLGFKKGPCKPPKKESSEDDDDDTVTPSIYQGYYLCTVDRLGHVQSVTGHTWVNPGWNAIAIGAGLDWSTNLGVNQPGIQLPGTYASGAWRLIATGLEVTNTTASLYKGGSVTCYRSPSPQGYGEYFVQASDEDPTVPCSGPTCVTPPFSQSDAALYPNSRTWGAEDGIYLIPTMNSTTNPYYVPKPGMAGMITPSSFSNLNLGNGWLGWFPFVSGSGGNYPNSSLATCLPWDISGAIFAGLNTQSAMQVTVRYYIERNPTIADPNLLVLARTPCPYDPVVQEIYTRCMEELPVGVKVGMNPLGEWFTEVLEGIGEWAPKIGSAIGNVVPGASIIGNIVGSAAKGIHIAGGFPISKGTTVKEKRTKKGKEIITVEKTRRKPPIRRTRRRVAPANEVASLQRMLNAQTRPTRGRKRRR